ncbi:DUF2000 domain-containing protein [Rathayibacter sp. VKM Ac-2878]|nr:DUF2000 domain-containing protein [Rathayibacter sp. VKM Ac-2878]MBF4462500.1 DUF2000 domain-containing protein [Rathayibacter sp. VKM Ac-2879]MBF4503457.1 DUF2000 domain-containing protein [Rathayibacter sp. VKM Ac-2878]
MTDEPVRFPTRVALVLRDDLEPWQVANVAAFLASGVAADPRLAGAPYVDADGTVYRPLLGQPIMVLEGDREDLRGVRSRAVARELDIAVFDAGMFATGHDAANREIVAAAAGDDLDLVGVAVHGAKNQVDRVLKGVRRHR